MSDLFTPSALAISLIDATVVAGVRAFGVAIVALLLGLWMLPGARAASVPARRWILALGGLACFAPTMLAGYGWLPTVTRWPADSVERESFYALALLLRFAPIGLLALWLARPGPDAAAARVWKTARGRGIRFWLREAGAAPWLSGGLVFLLAFQEFDLATSWGMRSWTVILFDAQIGGLPISDSLRLAAMPVLVEIAVIIPLLLSARSERRDRSERASRKYSAIHLATLCAGGLLFFLVIPAMAVFRLGGDAFRVWMESPSMLREIGHAGVSGAVAAIFAWVMSGLRLSSARVIFAVPGLFGPLLLGLVLLAALQGWPAAASSVLPWLCALTLYLLPVALLLRLLLERGTDRCGLHVATLSGARAVQWTLWRERAFAAALLLFCLGYSDFTISTLLAPPQFTTIFPRVFNLMHYGQSAVLSFSVLVACIVPLAAAALTLILLRFYVRQFVR